MLLPYYSIDPGTVKRVLDVAEGLGASKAELAALERLEGGHGLLADFERLAPLAMAAGIPWEPELQQLDTEDECAALERLLNGCTQCGGTGITMPPDMGLCGCIRNNLIFYIGALHGLESKLRRLEKKVRGAREMRTLIAQPIWGVECDFSLVPTCLGLVEGVAPAFVTFMISTFQVDCCRECCLHILAAMKHAPCVNVPVVIPDELENELQAQGREVKP